MKSFPELSNRKKSLIRAKLPPTESDVAVAAIRKRHIFIPSLEAEPTQADWVDILAQKSLLERAIERNLKHNEQ